MPENFDIIRRRTDDGLAAVKASAHTAIELAENRADENVDEQYIDPEIENRAYAFGVEEFIDYLQGGHPTPALRLVLRAGRVEGDDPDENGDEVIPVLEQAKAVERGDLPSGSVIVKVTGKNSLHSPGLPEDFVKRATERFTEISESHPHLD